MLARPKRFEPDPQIRSLMLFRRGSPGLEIRCHSHGPDRGTAILCLSFSVSSMAQTKVTAPRTDNSVDERGLHGRLLSVFLQQIIESFNGKGVKGGVLLRCQYS